jgi:hypothetical protein
MCFFSPLVLRIWLRSQAFAHMLRAPDLIPSTAQIELKELKTLVEELFFHFWAAFTIEASLCVVSATVVFKEFYSLRAGQVTICSTPSYPQILSPITASVQVSGWPRMHQRVDRANRTLNSALGGGELREDLVARLPISILTDSV